MTTCGKLNKLFLTMFNTLMIMVGFVKLSVGAAAHSDSRLHLLGETKVSFQGVPVSVGEIVLMVSGAVILVTAVLGFYGAFKENRAVLIACSAVLGPLSAVDFVSVILASIHNQQIEWNLIGFVLFACPGFLMVCCLVCSVVLAQLIKRARWEATVRFSA
ncbi:hypothetical protein MATL_G00219760 [Megalops atlanticus]|uniref:Uncharacterized protein n=1 Tax=Megalops atlanticus TaxID=7932 RepID=A0A9D3SXK4_MEGAT|nr:hypothetical protein MATL_G00219760 [Megalops atlanticus]